MGCNRGMSPVQSERMQRECLIETWGCEESTERGVSFRQLALSVQKAQAQKKERTAGVPLKPGWISQEPRPLLWPTDKTPAIKGGNNGRKLPDGRSTTGIHDGGRNRKLRARGGWARRRGCGPGGGPGSPRAADWSTPGSGGRGSWNCHLRRVSPGFEPGPRRLPSRSSEPGCDSL